MNAALAIAGTGLALAGNKKWHYLTAAAGAGIAELEPASGSSQKNADPDSK